MPDNPWRERALLAEAQCDDAVSDARRLSAEVGALANSNANLVAELAAWRSGAKSVGKGSGKEVGLKSPPAADESRLVADLRAELESSRRVAESLEAEAEALREASVANLSMSSASSTGNHRAAGQSGSLDQG
jgi:hypothetical protein